MNIEIEKTKTAKDYEGQEDIRAGSRRMDMEGIGYLIWDFPTNYGFEFKNGHCSENPELVKAAMEARINDKSVSYVADTNKKIVMIDAPPFKHIDDAIEELTDFVFERDTAYAVKFEFRDNDDTRYENDALERQLALLKNKYHETEARHGYLHMPHHYSNALNILINNAFKTEMTDADKIRLADDIAALRAKAESVRDELRIIESKMMEIREQMKKESDAAHAKLSETKPIGVRYLVLTEDT